MKFRRSPTLKSADDFISGAGLPIQTGNTGTASASASASAQPLPSNAGSTPSTGANSRSVPWEGKRDDKQTEVFNLRLTEVELEKLRYIAANTPDSMQTFIRKILLPALDVKVSELNGSV